MSSTSRSTSAGTSPPGSPPLEYAGVGIPDYSYPAPLWQIRNTFLDANVSNLFEAAWRDREIRSCPASGIGNQIPASRTASLETVQPPRWPSTMSEEALNEMVGVLTRDSAAASVLLHSGAFNVEETNSIPSVWGNFRASESAPCISAMTRSAVALESSETLGGPKILRLTEALDSPQLGSPELPSLGSTGHRMKTCKPCAFLYTKGCENGVRCTYCHLCEPGEKKRRAKEKKAASSWKLFG